MRPSAERAGGILAGLIKHRNAANILMFLLILFGFWGATHLNRQLMPTVETRVISISLSWSGASAEDIAKNLIQPIEPAVRFLDGVTGIDAFAREGNGSIVVAFDRSTNMEDAETRIAEAVKAVPNLPESADEPEVSKFKFFDSVASIGISGPFPEETLRRYAREIRDALLAKGLDQVSFAGYRDKQILITVDETRLRQMNTTLQDLANVITPNIADQPSGRLPGEFEAQIRAAADEVTPRGISETEVRSSPNGEALTFGDIATVTGTYDDSDALGYMRGQPAIRLTISRSANADAITAYELVKEYMVELEPTLPESLTLVIFNAPAEQINQRLSLLLTNGLTGMALVLLVLFVFLDGRVAFWVAMGIPVSILATLGIMQMMGQSIDMISMFALMMTLGIIVDDAIVVGEHTATRYAAGDSPSQAAITGAGRMAAPVIAASLTTIAAFGPILLVGGVAGQIMSALPFVVIAVLAASLLECFFILPGHLSHALPKVRKRPSAFRRRFDAGFGFVRERIVGPLANLTYSWRYAALAFALGGAILAGALLASSQLKFEFFPTAEGESFNVFANFQPGVPEDQMLGILREIEAAVAQVETNLAPEGETLVRTTYARLDIENGGANFDVFLTPSESRTIRTSQITAALREAIPSVAGVQRIGVRESRGGPQGRAIDVAFLGPDSATLKKASEELQDVLEGFDGITAVSDTLRYGNPELVMSLTSRGTALGFTLSNLGTQVRDTFEGRNVRTIITDGDETTIRIEQSNTKTGSGALRDLWVKAPQGAYVPLTSVVTISERQGFSRINRDEGQATISVRADVEEGVNAVSILTELTAQYLPDIAGKYGLSYKLGGRQAERASAFDDLGLGAMVALAVMYLIIAWIFQSYFAPLAVMLIIPFGAASAIWGHHLLGYNLSTVSLMGMLGLSGILVNDSIVLVSRIQERIEDGDSLRQASTGATRDRLRAVLLTSLTTIGGLTPLLFEKSLEAQFLIPMAITIVFGLGGATLLVLFLVPAFMGIGADIGALLNWLFFKRGNTSITDVLTGSHHDRPGVAPAE